MATLIHLFPYLLIALFAGVVLHFCFGGGARKSEARRIPRQHYRWDDQSPHR